MPTFIGMMRIKNEARWLPRVLDSISSLCSVIFVLDDHSIDGSKKIILENNKAVYLASPFPEVLDESRDKNWLLSTIIKTLPHAQLNINSPYWVLCVDGDEILESKGAGKILEWLDPHAVAYSLRIRYLWNKEDQERVDGVYANFRRPSLFRLINPEFKFQTTPWGGNLHCSSIPQEFLGHAKELDVSLLHYGYLDRQDRAMKFCWYNRVDPDNAAEDMYFHMIQGDGPVLWLAHKNLRDKVTVNVGADQKLKHAGPLQLASLVV